MDDPVIRPTTAHFPERPGGRVRPFGRRRSRALFTGIVALAGVMLAGFETAAWAVTTTALGGHASPSGFPVGSLIFDSATLGWGVSPTGTITFRLYPPTDPDCVAAAVFTTNTTVSGNGYYESARYASAMVGDYRWTARYNGDLNNSPSSTPCNLPAAIVSVAKRMPTLSASAFASPNQATTTDTATLNGYAPTGTMWFRLYGPNNMTCAGGPIYTSTRAVTGSGAYTTPAYTAPATGTYSWRVTYSGDSNNGAAGTTCTDPANAVDLIAGPTVGASPAVVARSASLTSTWNRIPSPTSTDWVGLYAVGGGDSAVAAWRYTNGAASGSVSFIVPWGTPPGSYEVRLLANNSYVRLATSGVVTVT